MSEGETRVSAAELPSEAPRVSPARRGAIWAWAMFVTTLGVVALLSLYAYTDRMPAFLGTNDKAFHFCLGALLAGSLDGALERRSFRLPGTRSPLFVLPLASLLLVPMALEEYAQRWARFRSSSLFDFAADVLGVALGLALSRALFRSPRP